jgi:hypothetical protein
MKLKNVFEKAQDDPCYKDQKPTLRNQDKITFRVMYEVKAQKKLFHNVL